ncbi:hypothetical protein ACLB2K_024917 [Fragaria x ananassa]
METEVGGGFRDRERGRERTQAQFGGTVTDTPKVQNHATSTPIRRVEVEQVEAPYVGMLFETVDEAIKYYEEYGRQEGFWILTQSSRRTRSRSDEVTSCQFVCAHQGKYVWKKTVKEGWKQNNQTKTSENNTEAGNEDDNGTEHAENGRDMNKKKGGLGGLDRVMARGHSLALTQRRKAKKMVATVYSMNTTGRSEGTNSFFYGFVTSTTNLREFVVKYDQALKRIIENESEEDFESEHKFRIMNDDEFILKDASKLYTRNIFNKFKAQCVLATILSVRSRGGVSSRCHLADEEFTSTSNRYSRRGEQSNYRDVPEETGASYGEL